MRTSLAYDHVVGVDRAIHTSWNGPYDVHTTFHDPFVFFGHLAAVEQQLDLACRARSLTRRARSSITPRSRADETPTRSSWNASSVGLATPTRSPPRPRR